MARVQYKGKIQRTMAQYEALTTLEQYADYDIIDHPDTYITNAQMTYALSCVRLFPAGDTYICSDTGTYTQGHIYKIKVNGSTKSWEDITDVSKYEEFTITSSSWTGLADKSPFTYSATVTASKTITDTTEVELINNQAVLFATYGFVIGEITGQTITLYAINQPTEEVTITIGIRG